MRRIALMILLLMPLLCSAQKKQGQARLDSLLAEVPKMKEDTNGVKLMDNIAFGYEDINPDEGLKWASKTLALSQKLDWREMEGVAYNTCGTILSVKGVFPDALDVLFKSLRIAEELHNKLLAGCVAGNIGGCIYA